MVSAMDASTPDDLPLHPIGVVSRRTGLKPDLVRAWERRYGAVSPRRSAGGRRLYSESDVERLRLLSRATRGGHPISQVVTLPDEHLRELAAQALEPAGAAVPRNDDPPPDRSSERVERCLAAVMALDAPRLLDELEQAASRLARRDLIESLLEPLMRSIGERWRARELEPAHEHLATATVRLFTARLPELHRLRPEGPGIVVTTPAGERHELGALLVAATASAEGWEVIYLGPDLPAEDVATAVGATRARAVTLSIACPDGNTASEVRRIAELLPAEVALLVGGRGAERIAGELGGLGIHLPDGLAGLRHHLAALA